MASPSTVITLGFGSFGSVNLLPTLGYGSVVDQVLGLWHDRGTSYDLKASGQTVAPFVTRNNDIAQVIQSDGEQ